MKLELIDKMADKNYSLQFFGTEEEIKNIRPIVCKEMNSEGSLIKAKPFLQGDSSDWLMVEFWTNDLDLIINSIEEFSKKYNLSI